MTTYPLALATADEMREMDRATIVEGGVPGIDLMETAGAGTAKALLALPPPSGPIVVMAGGGHNGGDALVAARHLALAGRPCEVLLFAEPDQLPEDAKTNYDRLPSPVSVRRIGTETFGPASEALRRAGTIVDGLFGTGLAREVGGIHAEAIRVANRSSALRVALDMPSGVSSDTGQVLGVAFRADRTYTYGLAKLGQMLYPGAEFCGHLTTIDIGLPPSVVRRIGTDASCFHESQARRTIGRRKPDTHKGTYGHLLLVAGSPGKSGAAILAAGAALRAGTGLVTVATDEATRLALAARHPEAMTFALPPGDPPSQATALYNATLRMNAVVFGPGWGADDKNLLLLREAALGRLDIPLLLDADALTLAATGGMGFLLERSMHGGQTVLTPHPGEASRLLGTTTDETPSEAGTYVHIP
ncbi:MAG: NAD(P)H-hydrate epimerase, partial [Myxococcales bacterium]